MNYNLEWLQTINTGSKLILTFDVREKYKEGIQFLKNVIKRTDYIANQRRAK